METAINKNSHYTLEYYKYILKDKKTLKVCDYKNYSSGIIVRHDIDFDVDLAYEFAKMEYSVGISSTYYFLLSTDAYNPFSADNKEMIKEIYEMGFEVGLHFDPTAYNKNINDYLSKEITIFKDVFGIDVKSFSMHQPSVNQINIHSDIISAYNSDIFGDDRYISDSCFSYRGKNPKEFLKKSDKRLIQFLTHPVHFSESGEVSYNSFFNYKMNSFKDIIHKVFVSNPIFNQQKDSYKIDLK